MFLEFAEYHFDPITRHIKVQSCASEGHFCNQTPGFLFTAFPIAQQVDMEDRLQTWYPESNQEFCPGFWIRLLKGCQLGT